MQGWAGPLRKLIAVLFLLALLATAGYAAQRATLESWRALPRVSAPPPEIPLPTGTTAALTDQVLLVVIDGLRTDSAMFMPTLDHLRRTGAYFSAQVPTPTWQHPSWVTLLTGAAPATHGVLTNEGPFPFSGDNLLAALRRRGMRTAAAGDPGWQDLFGPWITHGSFATAAAPGRPGGLAAAGAMELIAGGAPLVLLHLDGPRTRAAQMGAAGPGEPAYLQSLAGVDGWLAEVLDSAHPTRTTVVVTGAFGLTERGQHGGPEGAVARVPLILAGPGITPGEHGLAKLEDIAPTIATLLGTPLPALATGQPLWPALNLDEGAAAQRAGQVAAAQSELTRGEARTALRQAEQAERIPYGALLALPLFAYLALLFWQRYRMGVLTGLLIYLSAVHGIFVLRGGIYSFSLPGLQAPGLAFWLERGGEAAVAMALAAVATGWHVGRRAAAVPAPAGLVAVHTALAALAVTGLQAAAAFVLVGLPASAALAYPTITLKGHLDLMQASALGYLGPVWVLLGVAGARLAGRLHRPAQSGDPAAEQDPPRTPGPPFPPSAPLQHGSVVPLDAYRERSRPPAAPRRRW